MVNRNILYLVTSVDIDEDNFDKFVFPTSKKITWKGVEKGIPIILHGLKNYKDSFGEQVKFSWFVRCDKQLEILYGSSTYLFKKFQKLWEDRKSEGDEIAWHPHLYDHDANILNNERQLLEDMRKYFILASSNGFCINTSRIGRAFCSNAIMRTLYEIGIKVDSTAIPGRKRKDEFNMIDWKTTPQNPFFPSETDYRIPGDVHVDLLEVPMSMIKTNVSYDNYPVKRYVNLAFKNSVIKDSLCEYVRRNNLLVIIMHPSEVIRQMDHPLFSFDINEVKRNLDTIVSECGKLRKSIKFITMIEVLNLVGQGLINVE